MRVSLVTISFNQAEFLERAIRSVVDQSYEDIEYIVVDPGSTDGSREIIEHYRPKISKVIFEPDNGPADGLNRGFSKASGDIFGFLNSDDVLLPDAITKVVSFFHENPSTDVVSGHSLIIDETDRQIRKGYSDKFNLLRYAYAASISMQASTFFRADAFRKVGGFNSQNRVAWDGELLVDMGLSGARFFLVNEFWSGFRLHSQSITSSMKLDQAMRTYQKAIFKKIIGREMKFWDYPLMIIFRLFKHLKNPRALYERLSKGPIYGRSVRVN